MDRNDIRKKFAQSCVDAHIITIVTVTEFDALRGPVYQAVKATILTPIFARKGYCEPWAWVL